MTTKPSNLIGPNFTVNNESKTQDFFQGYYTKNYSVSANANDVIIGYFETVTNNSESARALAAAVIYTSLSKQIDPISLVEKFKKLNPGELDNYLSGFLNTNRVTTSLLGTINQPSVGKYVQRCILP